MGRTREKHACANLAERLRFEEAYRRKLRCFLDCRILIIPVVLTGATHSQSFLSDNARARPHERCSGLLCIAARAGVGAEHNCLRPKIAMSNNPQQSFAEYYSSTKISQKKLDSVGKTFGLPKSWYSISLLGALSQYKVSHRHGTANSVPQ